MNIISISLPVLLFVLNFKPSKGENFLILKGVLCYEFVFKFNQPFHYNLL
jgi:hypothetical protein